MELQIAALDVHEVGPLIDPKHPKELADLLEMILLQQLGIAFIKPNGEEDCRSVAHDASSIYPEDSRPVILQKVKVEDEIWSTPAGV